MRYTTFTEDEAHLLIEECWRGLADGTTPLSELTDQLLALPDFEFLRERLSTAGRRVAMNCVGNPLSMDCRFSTGRTFTNAAGDDDRLLARVDVALRGRVFTTQLSVADAATGSLSLGTDLVAFDDVLFWLDEFTVNGHVGSRTIDPATERCEVRGRDGWLDEFPLGSLLAVTWDEGDLQVTRLASELAAGTAEGQALVTYADSEPDGHGFCPYEPIIKQLTVDPDAYRVAVPPVSELLSARGFEHHGGWFGRAGTEWHEPDLAEELELRAYVGEKHDFGSCCFDAYDELLKLWGDHLVSIAESREPAVDYARVGDLLVHGAVADAFDDGLTHDRHGAGDISDLSNGFMVAVSNEYGPGATAARYLVGKSVERAGLFDEATMMYEAALSADQHYAPPCTQLAWLAFDRSEFGKARDLLTRSGLVPRSPEFKFLPSRVSGRSKPGRNACCPCGSGRKYKICHADTSLLSPWERLQLKYNRHSAVTKNHVGVAMMTLMACDIDPDRADQFRGDAFLTDLYQFEGNGLTKYADLRGSLFPADEQHVLDLLSQTRRSLCEVIRIDNGVWLQRLCNKTGLPADEALQLVGNSAPLELAPGDRILARLLPGSGEAATLVGFTLRIAKSIESSLRTALHAEHQIGASDTDDDQADEPDTAEQLAEWYITHFTAGSHRPTVNR